MYKEAEAFLPSFPLKRGVYSDLGSRLRRNEIKKSTCRFSIRPCFKKEVVYDDVNFNNDLFEYDDKDPAINNNKIADYYFRLDEYSYDATL